MPIYRAQIVMPMFTGTPTDVVTNQLHFSRNGGASGDNTSMVAKIATAWRLAYPDTATGRVNWIDWPLAHVKVFNLDDPTPRVPEIISLGYGTAGTGQSPVPTEVATVLSFHAAPESGVPYQRLYNRIFLGALPSSAMTNSAVDAFPTLSASWVLAVRNLAISLADNLDSVDEDGLWVQISPSSVLLAPRPVVGGWVDNSPDTQRRRSVLATSRNPWVPTP